MPFTYRGATQGPTRAETQAGNLLLQNRFANVQVTIVPLLHAAIPCLFPAVHSKFSVLCQKVDPQHSEGYRVLPAGRWDVTEIGLSLHVPTFSLALTSVVVPSVSSPS